MRTLLSIIQENGTGINSKKTGSNLCELHITESLTNCDFYGTIQRRERVRCIWRQQTLKSEKSIENEKRSLFP